MDGDSRPLLTGFDIGSDEYSAGCWDSDEDGYSDQRCGGTDCDDSEPAVHPGAAEGPYGDATCADTLDNDCDGSSDAADSGCVSECPDLDGDGYGNPANIDCPFPQEDCEDDDSTVNPGVTEIPDNGKDDDCDPSTPDAQSWSAATTAEASTLGVGAARNSGILNSVLGFALPLAAVLSLRRRRGRIS
ncbi:MAG: putative metal-binding motif-containing protein [bacterium]